MTLNNDVIGVPPLEDWQTLTRINGWVRHGMLLPDLRAFIDPMGIVHLSGVIGSGSALQFCTLPSRFRPSLERRFAASTLLSNGSLFPNRVIIQADGACLSSVSGVSWLSVEGITYRLD